MIQIIEADQRTDKFAAEFGRATFGNEAGGIQLAEYGHFQTSEPCEFELALAPWDVMVEPIEPGDHSFEIEYLSMTGLMVYQERYAKEVRLCGRPPCGRVAFALPGVDPKSTTVFGSPVQSDDIYALTGGVLETTYGPGYSQLVIELDLQCAYDDELALSLDRLTSERHSLTVLHSTLRRSGFRQAVTRAIAAASHTSPQNRPDLFEAIRQELESALVSAILPYDVDTVESYSNAQSAAVSKMLDYLSTPGVDCASVSELCASAGINQRTLERGVRGKFDCTVVQFLRNWRLRRTRHQLLVLDPRNTSVSKIAMSHGFFDLGRFAGSYFRAFGEYPSETLKAADRDRPQRLAWV